jgi:hypothetical protein
MTTLGARLPVSAQSATFIGTFILLATRRLQVQFKLTTQGKGALQTSPFILRGKAGTGQRHQLECVNSMNHDDSMRTNGCFTARVKVKPAPKG